MRAAGDEGETVRLYRAVSIAELQDILETGKLRPSRVSYELGKFFAKKVEDAHIWGDAFEGRGHYHVVEVEVSIALLDQTLRWPKLDGVGPARFLTIEQLEQVRLVLEAL